ncbi:MAG: hypothetical protein JSR93_10360 [Verrucomicrobia bacterium]|nr:hypothetical protein [Verrucomicrobiota bacterium]
MFNHPFLLTPSSWLGQGRIQLNMVAEELSFVTKWSVGGPDSDGRIECVQEIQVKGLSDVMHNQFNIFDLNSGEFQIELENDALGRITGKGLINEKIIAWEFRIEEMGFEGFELYEKQDEQNYLMRAEYATADQFRTLIQGKVWKQMEQKKDNGKP